MTEHGFLRNSVFGKKWREDREFCLWRINGFALGYGDFPENHFGELVFGDLVLGKPIKWAFLFPKKKSLISTFLGISVFGKRDAVFGKSPVARRKSHKNRGINT